MQHDDAAALSSDDVDVVDVEETWRDQPGYSMVVPSIRQSLDPVLASLIDDTPCFGWLWEDEGEVCPDAKQCALAQNCSVAYKAVEAAKASVEPRTLPPGPSRGRYRGKSKYTRRGWQDKGRLCDEMVIAWCGVFGDLPVADTVVSAQHWDAKYGHLGRALLSKPASYHALYLDGTILSRFWTNSPRRAVVDIVPDLVVDVRELAKTMAPEGREAAQIVEPFAIPEKVRHKSRPCTHRVTVHSTAAAKAVAEIIVKRFPVITGSG